VQAKAHLEETCHAIGHFLRILAEERCSGDISEERFVQSVLKLEAEHVTPHGFTLSACDTDDGWIAFEVRVVGSGETCAGFEFRWETGEFRRLDCGTDALLSVTAPMSVVDR
jgi:hypothetical protein